MKPVMTIRVDSPIRAKDLDHILEMVKQLRDKYSETYEVIITVNPIEVHVDHMVVVNICDQDPIKTVQAALEEKEELPEEIVPEESRSFLTGIMGLIRRKKE